MGALQLDTLTWPQVEAEIAAGRDTVVCAFGATEQHGPHMALATDSVIGDHLAALVAERLDAFVAPTVRIGCSRHHLGFAGTLSLSDETFHAIVGDLVRCFARSGFRRAVLLPTHGGNFAPLAQAVEQLGEVDGLEVAAITDVTVLLRIAQAGAEEHDVPLNEGGLHAGEWETSLMLSIRPDLVHMEQAEAGFTGDPQEALQGLFAGSVADISPNGALGDPTRASPAHGERYWALAADLVVEALGG